MSNEPGEVTVLLAAHERGDKDALPRLFELLYRELRMIARGAADRRRPNPTLDSVAIVHECYLRLARGGLHARDRGHFFASAARAMRHLVVDYARSRLRAKRRGEQASVDPDELAATNHVEEVLAVHEALDRMAAIDPRLVAVAECRYFAGYTVEETARHLELSVSTVERVWRALRAHLGRELAR